MALCYSFCRNLLKLRGLFDLCSLALGPTHCSVESLGKVLDAHETLEGPTLPHYYSGAELGFILILPNTCLLAFQTLCGTLSTAKAPTKAWSLSGMRGTKELAVTGQFPGMTTLNFY